MLDIFAPQISKVSYDLAGKSMLIYGSNRLGKTRNACDMPKPCYLAFEAGLGGIPGVPFFVMNTWRDYTDFIKQLIDPRNAERAHATYQTIIIDQVEALGDACAQYICSKFGVTSLGEKKRDANNSNKIDFTFNGYAELNKENQRWLRALTLAGYTVHFIGHAGTREVTDENGVTYSKIVPKGDKRIVDAICDAVDIIGYVKPNGLDEEGREIKSSLILANSPRALAGSRFDYLVPILNEYSAENLTKAIADAVKKQEKASGIKSVSLDEATAPYQPKKEEMPFDEMIARVGEFAEKLNRLGRADEYKNIVKENWGDPNTHKVQEATPINREAVEMIYNDLLRLEI